MSDDEAMLELQDLVEALQNPMPNAHFARINYTHHTALKNIAGLFNIIPNVVEQQSTNSNNGRRQEVEIGNRPSAHTNNASITHKLTVTPGTNSMGANKKNKPGRPPRVAPSEVPVQTPEQIKPVRPPRVTPSAVPMETKKK